MSSEPYAARMGSRLQARPQLSSHLCLECMSIRCTASCTWAFSVPWTAALTKHWPTKNARSTPNQYHLLSYSERTYVRHELFPSRYRRYKTLITSPFTFPRLLTQTTLQSPMKLSNSTLAFPATLQAVPEVRVSFDYRLALVGLLVLPDVEVS